MDTHSSNKDQLSSKPRRAANLFSGRAGLVLGLLFCLGFFTACSSLNLAPQESATFSFSAPSGQADAASADQAAAQNQELNTTAAPLEEADTQLDGQSTQNGQTAAEPASLQKAETQAEPAKVGDLELDRPTNPFSDQARIPLYARLEDAEINDEPAVPVSVPKDNPIRGIAGSRVERFFRTLSVNPVTYHYAVLPSEGDLKDAEDIDALEVYIALKDDMAYMRIDTKDSALALLQLSSSTYYQMDLIAGTYEILPGLTTQSNELSMDAFRQLETNAGNFINTGAGPALFFGQKVNFEEFTADGESYVRYYFVGDVLVGHRRFEDGKIVRTVRVFEASNRYDEDVFQIPEGLKQVSPGETLPKISEAITEVTVPDLNP